MRKRGIAVLLSLTVVAAMFSGCGSSEKKVEEGKGGEEIITVWMPEQSKGEQEVYEQNAAKYNEENGGKSRVELTFIPRGNGYEYENKLNAAAVSGDLPDIIFMDGPTVANYVSADLIQPLSPYFTEEEKAAFVPSIIEQGTINNELYAVGPSESSVVLYCNKKMFDEAGIEIPKTKEDAWSWEEVYHYAKQLQTKDRKGINLTWDLGEGQIYGLAPIVWSNGAELLDETGTKAKGYVNSKEAVDALKVYQKIATEGLMDLQALPDEFANGGSAMYLMGSWEYGNLVNNFPDLEFEVTFYPTSNKEVGVVSPSGDWAWGITSASKQPEMAANVIKFFTGEEQVEAYVKVSNKPASLISVLEKQELHPVIKEQVKTTAHPRPISTSYPVLSKEYSVAMQDIRTGADIQKALDTVAERFEADVERNK